MKQSAMPLSVRLPEGADALLSRIVKQQHISKAKFIREAIIEKIEDTLDIKAIEEVLARNEKTYSLDELKHELGLED